MTFSPQLFSGSPWLWQLLRRALLVMTRTVLRRAVRGFVGRPSTGTCLLIFIMIRLGSWVLGRKTAEVKCPPHHIISRHILMSWLSLWCWPWSPGWGRVCQVSPLSNSPPTPLHTSSLEGRHYVQLSLKEWGARLPFPEARQSTQITWNSAWESCLFSPIHLCITYLYQRGLVDLSYTLVYKPALPYLFCCSTCSNFGCFQVCWLLCPSEMSPQRMCV